MELNETKAKRTKQIKTIRTQLEYSGGFDADVNAALADGWYLVKRYTLPSYNSATHTMLVAELQRYVYD